MVKVQKYVALPKAEHEIHVSDKKHHVTKVKLPPPYTPQRESKRAHKSKVGAVALYINEAVPKLSLK